MRQNRTLVLILLVCSIALLLPGIFMPVLTIRGVLTKDGIAYVAPKLLEQGLSDDTVNLLKSMIKPELLGFIQFTGGDFRKVVIEKLGPQITAAVQKSAGDLQVYEQTRSIMGAVRRLYEVGSPFPATLILLFSVIVPFGKAALVAWAMFMSNVSSRERTLRFVETIAKWSMADVFVVALFITYLAAQASATPTSGPEAAPALIAFTAHFGPGFYWFAAYCLFSLASQQITVRAVRVDQR
jgi:Paraquat-inducible protein A